MTAPRSPELDRMTSDIIEYKQRYLNHQMYDNTARLVYYPQLTVPDDNPIPLADRIDALAHGTYAEIDRSRVPKWISSTNDISNRPNINHKLSTKVINAGNSDITFHILMTAYQKCIPVAVMTEPDGLWASNYMYMRIINLITSQPEFARIFEPGTARLLGVRFMAANLHHDKTIPPDEILLFNSRYPEYSARIINIYNPRPSSDLATD